MTSGAPADARLTKNQRREAAREKAKVLREQQKKRERRNRFLLQGGVIVAVLAIVAIVVLVVTQSIRPAGPGPRNMASDGVVLTEGLAVQTTPALAAGSAPTPFEPEEGVVDIQVYVDYLCPYCGQFENTNNEQIAQWLEDGAVTLGIHPIAILNAQSAGTRYPLRAANALACVADTAPDAVWDFHTSLFENQPAEGTAGLSDDDLKRLASEAGAEPADDIDRCISEGTFRNFVEDATERALQGPLPNSEVEAVTGTPTVLVNGKQYQGSLTDPAEFQAAVLSAAGEAYSTSTATPAPTDEPEVTDTPQPESTPSN